MKKVFFILVVFVLALAAADHIRAADIKILHAFPNGPNDGSGAGGYDSLKISGSTMYGSTASGGLYRGGTLFKLQLDGSQYQTIYSLSAGPCPWGVTLDNSTIYGTILTGGANSWGAVYKVQTNGTGYQVLHSFTRSNGDGAQMYSGVALSGPRLYGVAVIGGINDNGVVFSMAKDGSDYRILHSFTDGNDGCRPYSEPTVSGSVLYGLSSDSIYKMNIDGTGFQVLRPGIGGISKLTLNGSTLYGTSGGSAFSIGTDGSNFKVLHELSGSSQCGLSLAGSTLYGMSRWGGSADKGTIFSVNTDGSNYQVLHTFLGGSDGEQPICDPIVIGSTLYGSVSGGPNGGGYLFSMTVPEPSVFTLLAISSFGMFALAWHRIRGIINM
jgi:uncharacterized repeat protein (TIGR03803 family)